MRINQVVLRSVKISASLLALLVIAGCASLRSTSSRQLNQHIAQANAAYQNLNNGRSVSAYNNAVASIAREIDGQTPNELRAQLEAVGVTLDQPRIKLPLARYYLAPRSRLSDDSGRIGVSILLECDVSKAPLYPRDGLMIAATAVYREVDGEPHISLVSGKDTIALNGSSYPLKIDNAAPITAMAKRGRHIARSGFSYMLHPAAMRDRTGIFLTEPYDPNKRIVLMVPGLQSTPFAFVDLIKQIRRDPNLNAHFQVWTFLYGSGTPVLFNALELRRELDKTIRAVDPQDRDFATRHIVVLGHSMGGLIAHTLVSSSGEKLWDALFTVPPLQLRGDKTEIRQFKEALQFRRDPRVVRAIFAATPHRGSNLAVSWIGHIAASLIRLPVNLQTAIVDVANANVNVATPEAKTFHRELNFSSVRTLSPNDPVLKTLAALPVAVPFHSIIGQHNGGPTETGSDGVVAYSSAHLDGATSEVIVRSGHNVCENPEGQREIIRILHLEVQSDRAVARR